MGDGITDARFAPRREPRCTTVAGIKATAHELLGCSPDECLVEELVDFAECVITVPGYINREDFETFLNALADETPAAVSIRLKRATTLREPRYNAAFRLGGWVAVQELLLLERDERQ